MSKNIFKTDFSSSPESSDPEELFHNLRGRSSEIKHLWSHQADLLRSYSEECLDMSDVALELPTGSGKTLVGLLIAEWRRKQYGHRVAYLCPTRQLAFQVGRKAGDYGIKANVLVGSQKNYSPGEFSEYQSAQVIAVTTYSAVFNSNPRIDNAETLILDDAHAGESFIANMWSMSINLSEQPDVYKGLVDLCKDGLPSEARRDFLAESAGDPLKSGLLELISPVFIRRASGAICDYLDEQIKYGSRLWFAWNLIRNHLSSCNFFFSCSSILVRPLIPPTKTHLPFSSATQKIYMSATLGAGGELERVTGVKQMHKLPIPSGWDKRSSGRRLFIIPEIDMHEEDMLEVVSAALRDFERSLLLIPSKHNREVACLKKSLKEAQKKIITASDIEDSIDSFAESTNAVLVLSRYDGLDLPDDICRLLIFGGLPCGTNLQERFFWTKIGALALLRDRVITRFVQGVGRCTRSDSDYSIVLIIGRKIVDFLLKRENLGLLNPELQAELSFGFENSKGKKTEDFVELWRAFLASDENWQDAESAILAHRDGLDYRTDPASEKLYSVVSDEVQYMYSIWDENYQQALECARKVADNLGGDDTKSYRAWWYYLAAESAIALKEETGEDHYGKTASNFLKRASDCTVGVRWLTHLQKSLANEVVISEIDSVSAQAADSILEILENLGAAGPKFEKKLADIAENLRAIPHKQFHQGLSGLGFLLGFDVELPPGDGAPDCIWSIGNSVFIAHEAKSEHNPDNAIGINDIRQAESHTRWLKANRPASIGAKILCLIESPRITLAPDALAFAGELHHCTPEYLGSILEDTISVLRGIRYKVSDVSGEKILEELLFELNSKELTPLQVLKRLSTTPVAGMGKHGDSCKDLIT